jgi:hypothetical protein
MRRKRCGTLRILVVLAVAAGAACAAQAGSASVLLARNAHEVQLKVTPGGRALVQYDHGGTNYILAWGALNSRPHPKCGRLQGPLCGPAQVEMKHRRIFAAGHSGRQVIKGPNRCRPYDGPDLAWVVAACKAPDGTYWALQSWVRIARHHGAIAGGVKELRLSHWSGPLEKVVVKQTWQKAHHHYGERLYGHITYRGKPVYGLRWDHLGVPLDGYGRVMYFDTLNSGYGGGWHRLDGFLSKPNSGQYCYNIGLFGPHAGGAGEQYRVTAMGTGVTPDVRVGPFASKPESVFDWDAYVRAYIEQTQLAKGSKFCHPQRPR